MNEKIYEEVSIVIIGYDPYEDVWKHCFDLFNRYWKDRPQTYLITNEITPEYKDVKVYAAGKDAEWSKKVQCALQVVNTKYIILMLEDFFVTYPVDNRNLIELIECIEENEIKYCKLKDQVKIKGAAFNDYKYLKIVEKKQEYGISLQAAIWERDFLKELVGKENYNAWIFELKQVKNRPQNKERIDSIADTRNILEITHTIVQSKYLPSAIRIFKKQGYEINLKKRETLSSSENFKYRLKCFVSGIAPEFLRPILKKIGRMMKVDFVSDRVNK